ncbi:hypothetical protein C8R47DRAFT_293632 [Mycena vitilis]|nr:hypothetical protein C8R47DRAFT_293632 [Mycena vitilis]
MILRAAYFSHALAYSRLRGSTGTGSRFQGERRARESPVIPIAETRRLNGCRVSRVRMVPSPDVVPPPTENKAVGYLTYHCCLPTLSVCLLGLPELTGRPLPGAPKFSAVAFDALPHVARCCCYEETIFGERRLEENFSLGCLLWTVQRRASIKYQWRRAKSSTCLSREAQTHVVSSRRETASAEGAASIWNTRSYGYKICTSRINAACGRMGSACKI